MSLEDRIMGDLKEAMKAKDKAALRGIRAIKSALLLAKTDGSGEVMDEAKEIKMLQKLVKQREESLSIYVKQKREDLAEIEKEELDILKRYLPTPLSEAELTTLIKQIIADTGASGIKDMGKVMGLASTQLGGKADGKTISNVVKSLLV